VSGTEFINAVLKECFQAAAEFPDSVLSSPLLLFISAVIKSMKKALALLIDGTSAI
jgi:hypothetical protein